jgi:hypothetical protein
MIAEVVPSTIVEVSKLVHAAAEVEIEAGAIRTRKPP